MRTIASILCLLLGPSFAVIDLPAATKTWNGSTSGSWQIASNWIPAGVPINGDTLVFPATATRLNTTNGPGGPTNLTALRITGSGYTIQSPALTITNSFTNSAAVNSVNTLRAPLTTLRSHLWFVDGRNTLILASDVTVAGSQAAEIEGTLRFERDLTGNVTFTKEGAGGLVVNGSSSLRQINVNEGSLVVDGTHSGGLSVGTGAIIGGDGTVSELENAGRCLPGTTAAGRLTVSGTPDFQPGSTLDLQLNGIAPGATHDQLVVGGAFNLGNVTPVFTLGFAAQPGHAFVILTNTGPGAFTNTFPGLPQGSEVSIGGTAMRITYLASSVRLSVLGTNATRTWSGAGVNRLWSTPANWVGNIAPVDGDFLVFPTNVVATLRTNQNDLPPGTLFSGISVTDARWVLSGNAIRLSGGIAVTNLSAAPSPTLQFGITGHTNLTWIVRASAFAHNGPLDLETNTATVNAIGTSSSAVLRGQISGAGQLIAAGAGRIDINGSNTFTGGVQLDGATVGAGGTHRDGAPWNIRNGTSRLILSGTIPGLTANVGTIQIPFLANVNTIDGDLTLGSAARVDYSGEFNPLFVNGTVHLGGAALINLPTTPFSLPPGGAEIVLIDNDGTDPVVGTFGGLPEGSIINIGSQTRQLRYGGGTGNDVTLTASCDPPTPRNLRVFGFGPEPSRLAIRWDPVTLGCAPGIREYVLFRNGLEVARNTDPTGVDTYLIAGRTYTFQVASVNSNGVMSQLSTGLVVNALPPRPIVGTKKVVNLLVRFADFANEPFGTNHANNVMFTGTNSVRAYFQEVSRGRMNLSGASYGWFTLPGIASNYCSLWFAGQPQGFQCDVTEIREQILAMLSPAISNEVATADFVQFIVHGMGTVAVNSGTLYYSATNGFEHGAVIHEMGHGLNTLLHAGSWEDCDVFPVGPDLSNLTNGGCNVFRYADPYDPMGGATSFHFNMWFKEILGWIDPVNISSVTTNGEYLLHRVEVPTNKPQVLKFDLGNEQFYLFEYRTPIGMDGPASPDTEGIPAVDGVQVRLRVSRFPGTDVNTLLLPDAFRNTQAFLDPYRGLLVELLGKSNGVARLRVTTNYQHTLRIAGLQHAGPDNRNIALAWNGVPGVKHFVESSTNLITWQPVASNLLATAITTTNLLNNAGTNRHRFFRVGQQPNP